MTISKSHIIDREAQNAFYDSLPSSWLIRSQKPDYYIDYFVELEKGAEPSGLIFGVQLKGTRSLQCAKNFIKQPIKTKHLAYYIDKVRQPVFIVVMDVTSRQGYWIFIQEWIRKELKEKEWRSIKKVNVRISLDNNLRDITSLSSAIAKADKYMRDLWPGSINSAVLSKKAELESLDPRFTVDISYGQGRTTYCLLPNERVEGSIQISHSDKGELQKKISDLVGRGLPVKFQRNEISISGTELFEKIMEDFSVQEVELQTCRKVHCQFGFALVDGEKEEPMLYGLNGQLSGGTCEIQFQSNSPEMPLSIQGSILWNDMVKKGPGNISLSLDPEKWIGQPLLQLYYFDAISKIVTGLSSGKSLKILCEYNGNRLFSAVPNFDDIETFSASLMSLTSYLQMAREVTQKFGINPRLPSIKTLSDQDLETIELLWTIHTEGFARQKAEGSKVSFTLSPTTDFIEMVNPATNQEFTFLILGEPNIEFFGYRIKDLCLAYQFLKWSLTQESRTRIGDLDENTLSEPIYVELIGGEGAEIIITLQQNNLTGSGIGISSPH